MIIPDDAPADFYRELLIRVLAMYAEAVERGPMIVLQTRVIYVNTQGQAGYAL